MSIRELEREAERNREGLLDSVAALQHRLTPTAVKHDVQDYMRNRTNRLTASLERSARDNPVQALAIAAAAAYPLWGLISRLPAPLLVIGAGVALSRRTAGSDQAAGRSNFVEGAKENLGTYADAALEKIASAKASVQEQAEFGMKVARGAVDRASATATRISGRTREITAQTSGKIFGTTEEFGADDDPYGSAVDTMSADSMRAAATRANDWIGDTVSRNPLLVGAVGLAIGAAIAAALPKTRQEDQLLGSASDHLKQRAGEVAVAGVDAAKHVAADVYRDVKTSAEEQGLSAEGLKDTANDVAERLRSAASAFWQDQSQGRDETYSPNASIKMGEAS